MCFIDLHEGFRLHAAQKVVILPPRNENANSPCTTFLIILHATGAVVKTARNDSE